MSDEDAGGGDLRTGLRADVRLGTFGAVLTATGLAIVAYAALRFMWRQVFGDGIGRRFRG